VSKCKEVNCDRFTWVTYLDNRPAILQSGAVRFSCTGVHEAARFNKRHGDEAIHLLRSERSASDRPLQNIRRITREQTDSRWCRNTTDLLDPCRSARHDRLQFGCVSWRELLRSSRRADLDSARRKCVPARRDFVNAPLRLEKRGGQGDPIF